MEKILNRLSGTVKLLVTGAQTGRFLNLCKANGILLKEICAREETSFTCSLPLRQFFLLGPIRRKTRVRIHILEKRGLPFFLHRNQKRKTFFVSLLLALCLTGILSLRIWNIHIEGNEKNSTPELLSFLEGQGIVHGIPKHRINCSDIAAAVRKAYPEITWVSARVEGVRLILTVQEGAFPKVQKQEQETPCSLVSQCTGTIVDMVTRRGVPVLQVGDTCEKGELLVEGRLEIKNDSQEVIRYDYVPSDADIYVRHKLAYYESIPRVYEKQTFTGKEEKGFFLKLGSWNLFLGPGQRKNHDLLLEEKPLRLTENFTLPLSFGTLLSREFQKEKGRYTKEQVREKALARLHLYQKKLLSRGIQIVDQSLKTQVTEEACTVRGYFTVIEKTGKKVPVERLPQPKSEEEPHVF